MANAAILQQPFFLAVCMYYSSKEERSMPQTTGKYRPAVFILLCMIQVTSARGPGGVFRFTVSLDNLIDT